MIYSIVPTDVVFFDNTQIRQRHLKMYNNVTLELTDGRVERIISTNPQDYLKYHQLKFLPPGMRLGYIVAPAPL